MYFEPVRMRFGGFIAPFHGLRENPTLILERDIKLGQVLDELGYDEYWVGEHHSAGVEVISSPELLLSVVAERTKRIRLGTGVNSLCYHHPLVLADRIVQLDHQTRGRIMFGAGPGQLPSDAFMFGFSPLQQRDMMNEALGVILALLRGETVTHKADWFTLHEGRIQLLPYQRPMMDICVACAVTPNGPSLAGRSGTGMLSVAASSKEGFEALAHQWRYCEDAAAKAGQTVSRENWRIVLPMHIAETREKAYADVEWGIMNTVDYYRKLSGKLGETMGFANVSDPTEAVRIWTTEGFGLTGRAMVGTPDDALAYLRRVQEQSGGFGCLLVATVNAANFEATCKSYDLFARYVMPQVQQSNGNREASLDWTSRNSEKFVGTLLQGMKETTEKFKAS